MLNGTTNRRVLLLAGLAAVIGLAGGLAAYALIHLIALLTNLAFFIASAGPCRRSRTCRAAPTS